METQAQGGFLIVDLLEFIGVEIGGGGCGCCWKIGFGWGCVGAPFFEGLRSGEGRPTNRWSFPFLEGTFSAVRLIPPGLCLSLRETLVARCAGRAL